MKDNCINSEDLLRNFDSTIAVENNLHFGEAPVRQGILFIINLGLIPRIQ